jgi:hypothetical protein
MATMTPRSGQAFWRASRRPSFPLLLPVSPFHPVYRALVLASALSLAGCSTDDLSPSDRTASIRPAQAGLTSRAPAAETLPDATSPIPAEGIDIDAMVAPARGATASGTEPVVGLAEEQSRDIHPAGMASPSGTLAPPLVDGIGTNSVHMLSVPQAPGALAAAPDGADPDLPPMTPARQAMEAQRKAQFLEQEQRVMVQRRGAKPRNEGLRNEGPRNEGLRNEGARSQGAREEQVAFLPRANSPLSDMSSGRSSGPMSQPEGAGPMPASEVACRQRLTKLGVSFTDVPRISGGPSCGIDYPIQLSGLSGNIAVKPAVKLNCEVTEAFALWVRNELAPSARYRYLSGIGTIKPLGGYSCRTMNSRRGAAMSEHAHGNAIDVGKFVLKNGKEIDVRKPGFFAFREKGLLKAVRQDSCKYFNTVLGPGSDPYHKDHFHFDLRERKSGYRHCS